MRSRPGALAFFVLAPLMLARCSTFTTADSTETDAGPDDAAPALDGAVADAPLLDTGIDADAPGPMLIGSAQTLSSTAFVAAEVPAGALPGDLIVAFWCARDVAAADMKPADPTAWRGLGSVGASYSDSGGQSHRSGFWVGYRFLAAGEGDGTGFPLTAGSATGESAVTLVAYRGARVAQPIDPSVVQSVSAPVTAAGLVAFNLPSLDPPTRAKGLFGVCAFGEVTLPVVAGFDRLQTSAAFAVYAPPGLLAPQMTAMGPDFTVAIAGVSDQMASTVGGASLAIVPAL